MQFIRPIQKAQSNEDRLVTFHKRECNVQLTLRRCGIAGQCGKLIVNGKEHIFATTDGMGEFFGELMGIMTALLGCCGRCDQRFFDKKS